MGRSKSGGRWQGDKKPVGALFCDGRRVGQIHPGDVVAQLDRAAAVEIREDDDRQLVVDVAGDAGVESLPGAAVFDDAMTIHLIDRPGKTVIRAVGLSVV